MMDASSFQAAEAARNAQFSGSRFQGGGAGGLYPPLPSHEAPSWRRQVADVAGQALTQSLDFLGLPADSFGPGQIHLFLCADQAEYLARSPFTKSWEAGSALPEKHQIYLYRFPDNQASYFEVVLAHELTHLCYHRLVPASRSDSWLNEGLADYLGYKFGLERAHFPRQAWLMANVFNALKKEALPFDAFLTENPQTMGDDKAIDLFYIQGFSIVDVLIEQYGREPFLHFLRVFGHRGRRCQNRLLLVIPPYGPCRSCKRSGSCSCVETLRLDALFGAVLTLPPFPWMPGGNSSDEARN